MNAEVSAGRCPSRLPLQEFPDVPKSAKYDGKIKPDKIDWDKIIKDVLEAGKEVPEIDWAKPGADAGLAVSSSAE